MAVARTKGGSNDTLFWFMEVQEVNRVAFSKEDRKDSYGLSVQEGLKHISGLFLEKVDLYSNMKKTVYKRSKKLSYFHKDSIMYPYVNMVEGKHGLTLSAEDYRDIILYIEKMKYTHL